MHSNYLKYHQCRKQCIASLSVQWCARTDAAKYQFNTDTYMYCFSIWGLVIHTLIRSIFPPLKYNTLIQFWNIPCMANSYFKNADRDYFKAYIYINNKFSIQFPETDSKRLISIEKILKLHTFLRAWCKNIIQLHTVTTDWEYMPGEREGVV